MDAIQIGKKLKELRGNRSIAEVSAILGISKSALCMYETGIRIPRDEVKNKLATYYGVSVSSIFFEI